MPGGASAKGTGTGRRGMSSQCGRGTQACASWTAVPLVPVLVCTPPEKTVGLGDSISAAGLELHEFIKKQDRARPPSTEGMGSAPAHAEDFGPPTAARMRPGGASQHSDEL